MRDLSFEKVNSRRYRIRLDGREVGVIVRGESYSKDWSLVIPGWWDHPVFDTLTEAKRYVLRVAHHEW
jgi:hypothetical protein